MEGLIIEALLANDQAAMALWKIKSEMVPAKFYKCRSNLHANAIMLWEGYEVNGEEQE